MIRETQTARDRGFSLIESLIALMLLLAIMSAVFGLLNPGSLMSRMHPESIDIQQRMRVAVDAIERDLLDAGAGLESGPAIGPLVNYFAPIVPRRMGLQNPDTYTVARADAITIHRTARSYVQTTLHDPMGAGATSLTVDEPPGCPVRNGICGLSRDMSILVFDTVANFDAFVVTQALSPSVLLQPRQRSPAAGYARGSLVAEAASDTY